MHRLPRARPRGGPPLQPEESTSFDLGVEKGQRGSGLHLALTGFRRDSDNLIGFGFTADRPSGVYLNTAEARAQGIEAEAGIDLAPGRLLETRRKADPARRERILKAVAAEPAGSAILLAMDDDLEGDVISFDVADIIYKAYPRLGPTMFRLRT